LNQDLDFEMKRGIKSNQAFLQFRFGFRSSKSSKSLKALEKLKSFEKARKAQIWQIPRL
jgi:hypothetical protein